MLNCIIGKTCIYRGICKFSYIPVHGSIKVPRWVITTIQLDRAALASCHHVMQAYIMVNGGIVGDNSIYDIMSLPPPSNSLTDV